MVLVVAIVDRVGPCPDWMRKGKVDGEREVDGEMEGQSIVSGDSMCRICRCPRGQPNLGVEFHTVHLWCVP